MVFKDIKPESFTCDWESSADGGKTWKLSWHPVQAHEQKIAALYLNNSLSSPPIRVGREFALFPTFAAD